MNITFNAIGFLTYDQNDLSMSFQPYKSVNNMASGLLQTSGPDNIIFFIKPRLKLY